MKRFLLLGIFILTFLAVFAQGKTIGNDANEQVRREPSTHVTAAQAMEVGYAFMHTGSGSKSGGVQRNAVSKQAMQLVYTGRATDSLTRATTDCYYVFALQPKGFVIVAADDRVNPILGYSYDNNFVVENMPEHVRSWLGGYEQQIQFVKKSNVQTEPTTQTKWARLKSGQSLNTRNGNTVGPLITTQWDQEYPYNTLCPIDNNSSDGHVATGCVATAMAQIINYWGYPVHGRGIHSYNSYYYGAQTVNYDNATYDYTNMPVSLSTNSTPEEVDAVATLMYHCGVAVNMGYMPEASGALDVDVRAALVDQFRFSPKMGFADRDLYSYTEWLSMLQNELDNGRPVFYGGVSGYGINAIGHAFICDGYDDGNYFHFNFGWSGNGDGWYLTSVINPGIYDFKNNQIAIMGIKPDSLSNIFYSNVGQVSNGFTHYSIDSMMYLGNELYDNPYNIFYGEGAGENVVAFYPADTTKQLVLEYLLFEELRYSNNGYDEDRQYVYIFDGLPESYLTPDGSTNYRLPDSLIKHYDENEDNADRSPVVSTKHGLTLVIQNRFREDHNFRFRISYDNGCYLVSNIKTTIDTNTVNIHWHENGDATQWQVEYGLKGFHHGEGTRLTVSDTAATLTNLISFREYDIYVRPLCDTIGNDSWSEAVTVMPEARYWTDVVTSQPEGYVVDSIGNVSISSAEGLAWLSKLIWDNIGNPYPDYFSGRKVVLTADINLGRYKWKPIDLFSGVFDGQGHRIDSMYVIDASYNNTALFGSIKYATLKNIYLTNCYSKQLTNQYAAGLVVSGFGDENHKDTIMNCFVSGRIEGHGHNVAPVVAHPKNIFIINCATNCVVTATDVLCANVGGIIGDGLNVEKVVLRNCYTASKIYYFKNSTYSYFTGYALGVISENCYAYVARNGYMYLLSGGAELYRDITWFNDTDNGFQLIEPIYFEPDNQYYSNLTEALNAGVRKYNLDGLRLWVDDTAGINEGMPIFGPEYVVTCPNIQNISARNVVGENGEYGVELSWNETGDAIAWEIEYRMLDSTNKTRVITTNKPDTLFGLTIQTTYLFRMRPICGTANYGGWSEEYSHVFDRPYWTEIVTVQPEGYSIDADGNVAISTAEGLAWLISVVNGLNGQEVDNFEGKTVSLTQDVNIEQYRWMAINGFSGNFKGQNNTISGLFINEYADNQGLFGVVNGGTYSDIKLSNAYVKGLNYCGILFGFVYNASVTNCHTSGTTSGGSRIGGISGSGNGTCVNYCSSAGTIQADNVAGGLIGHLEGTLLMNSHSSCNVVSVNNVGGLCESIGRNPVINCYFTGTVYGENGNAGGLLSNTYGIVQNCYVGGTVSVDPFYSIVEDEGGVWAPRRGTFMGSPHMYQSPKISYCYGLFNDDCPLFGVPYVGGVPIISDTASFIRRNDSLVLLNNVAVGQNHYNDLLEVLNAWVDTYDTAGMFLHWVADTAGVNGGFPIFEEIRYNTITLFVADSTPYGTVDGAGTYANYESTIITAIPDYGYHFVQWNDGNTDNPRTVKLTQDTSFTAIFEKNRYVVVGSSNLNVNYYYDFEDSTSDSQWTFLNGHHVNRWYIDTLEGANRALFISNNYGKTNTYSPSESESWSNSTTSSYVFAYTTMMLDSGRYNYSYEWRCNGMGANDFARIGLLPSSEPLNTDEWTGLSLPSKAIALDEGVYITSCYCYQNSLFRQPTWTSHPRSGTEITVVIPSAGEYRLVCFWENTLQYDYQPPAAFDNIHFYNDIPSEESTHGYVLGSDTVPYLDTVELTAIPYEGYKFVRWTDGNTDNPRKVVATTDKYFLAQFVARCPDTTIIAYLSGNGYEYDGQTYTEAGFYTFNYPIDPDCDSVVNLILCNESYIDLYDTIPRGTEYNANGFYISAGRTQNVRQLQRSNSFLTSLGCDSVHILHLTLTGTPIFYVSQNGTGDGSSWANAMGDLQMALDLAGQVQGDVWVAEGTYYGDGISENAFSIPYGVHVYGGFAGNEPEDYDLNMRDFDAHPTILDGQHVQRTVYDAWSGVSIIDGFTIQNGYNNYISNVLSFGELINCIIQGGVGSTIIYGPTIRNSIIRNNAGEAIVQYGHLFNCTVANNSTSDYRCIVLSSTLYNCTIVNNSTSEYGYVALNSTLTNCILWGNNGNTADCSILYSAVEDEWDVSGDGNILLAHNNDGAFSDFNYVRFVDSENGDFRLAYGSACINAGTPDISGLGLPTVDLQGLPRVLDGRIDIGAYEYYPVPVVDTYDTICEGGALAFFDSICAVEGQYLHHTSKDVMQDTLHILNLTINHATNLSFTVDTCDGYSWNDSTYRTSGTYTYTHEDANGCTQVDTLHLTINPTYNVTDAQTICASELPITWNGVEFTQAGTQIATLQTVNGCDSVVTMTLETLPTFNVTDAQTICVSELPYTWNGVEFTEAGTKIATLQTVNGCDSVVTMNMTVNPVYDVTDAQTICASELPITWNGVEFTEAGTQTVTLQTVNGCDSVVTMTLETLPTFNVADAQTICASELPITWNGVEFTQAGTQIATLQTVNGCDSVVTMNLIVNTSTEGDTTASVCGSFDWYGMHLTQSGNYNHTLTNAAGCDSVVTLHLTINTPVAESVEAAACDSYTWNGVAYAESGDYTQTFTAANGCDSVVTLHLNINSPVAESVEATACDSYTWNGVAYAESGDYTQTFTAANGCDSVVTLHLTINTPVAESVEAAACDSYTWNGVDYAESGDFTQTFTAANGCDSVVTLHLTVNPSVNIEAYLTISENDLPFTYGDTTFMPGTVQSGDYTFNFTTADGCDSVIILHLTVETGINDYALNASMKVYPNPTKDVVNVQLIINNEQLDEVGIQVFDIYGRLLEVVNMEGARGASHQTTQIDLLQYANGVYFVKAVSEGKVIAVRKVVKN